MNDLDFNNLLTYKKFEEQDRCLGQEADAALTAVYIGAGTDTRPLLTLFHVKHFCM